MKNTTVAISTNKRHEAHSPKTPAVPPAIESHRKPREFNRTQEIVIDAVGDMLVGGGHPASIDLLVAAAVDHYSRRIAAPLYNDDQEKFEASVAKSHAVLRSEWKYDLETAVRLNKRAPEVERQTPANATERIRRAVRDRVKRLLTWFMSSGTPEEMGLLEDVLITWDSRHVRPHQKLDEVPLARGFEEAMGRQATFIKVPERMVEKVQRYINALREIERKEA